MKLQRIYKIIRYVLPILILPLFFFQGVLFLSASYALFLVDVHNIDTTLSSLQSSSSDVTISLDPSYAEVYGPAPYKIGLDPICNQYDEDFIDCLDPVPDLCPYISFQPKNEEPTEIGSAQNKNYGSAEGQLYNPSYVDEDNSLTEPLDETDTWTFSVTSPCFEGQCPADYDAYLNGDPLPQSLKGATFKCSVHVYATDAPPLSMGINTAHADTASDEIIVSAVLTGEITAPVRNPVLIVPGLLGTEINKTSPDGLERIWLDMIGIITDLNNNFLEPLSLNKDFMPSDTSVVIGDVVGKLLTFDYSFSLVEEFKNQGYVEGTDLFLFPYDWRFGVSEGNVKNLEQKIINVLTQTGSERIDVIAHSTGGLIVKKYVVENPADHQIDKAIFVGVPNTGAPKAVKALIQGDSFGVPRLSDQEMKKISRNLPVAYDLSPSEEYFNKKGSYVKVIDYYLFSKESRDLDFEESNIFIVNDHDLNAQALVNAHNLHTKSFDNYDLRNTGIDLYSINGCKAGTIGKFVESREHGIFGGDGYTINNFKIEQVPGDGTVPLESATNLPINESNKYYALNASHAEMMSQDGIRHKIVNILSGSDLETEEITQDISECKLNGRAISIFSPLAIDIVDQDGNHVGLSEDGVSIENNIPNADFQIIDDHKFVYLPTDNGQTYTINVTGTGTGVFTLTDAVIDDNEITSMQVFSNISVTPSLLGNVNISDNTILELDDDGNGDVDQTITADLVLGAEDAKNFIPEPENKEEPQVSESNSSSGSRTKEKLEDIEKLSDSDGLVLGVEKANLPVVAISNMAEITEHEMETEEFESLEEYIETENNFTANVVEIEDYSNTYFVIVFITGILVLLLVARKFNKM